MPDTVKKEMSLRLESYYGRFALYPQDDVAREWIEDRIGIDDGVTDTERREKKAWYLGPHHRLESILRDFMREGGVIG